MKHIYKKVYINPLFYIFGLIMFLCGLFKTFILLTSLIIIHEIGHVTGAIIYRWNIEKIVFLPLGGITVFNEKINRPIKEELVILLLGPLFQTVFFIIISLFSSDIVFKQCHFVLLFFNLLPIYPLDGAKLVKNVLELFIPYLSSAKLVILISFVTIFFMMYFMVFYEKNIIISVALVFLFLNLFKELLKVNLLFEKFLLERYLYKLVLTKQIIIDNLDFKKMKRDCYHIFVINNQFIEEKKVLTNYYNC